MEWIRNARSPQSLAALTGFVLAAIVLLAVLAPPASAADNWSGIWNTHHKFGEPKLDLELVKKDGADLIKGKYYANGALRGHIHGERGKADGTEFWSGTFRDIGVHDSKGKFTVVLRSDQVSFVGWFKTCGRFGGCSERYKWRGEHA